jgi:excisionase family DNA binding protein
MERNLTSAQAAALLKCTPSWICRLCQEGGIGIKFGRDWLVSLEEVMAYQHKRRRPGRPKTKGTPLSSERGRGKG